jgi:FlaA1/EpsC-like NDP-sugar epimerase
MLNTFYRQLHRWITHPRALNLGRRLVPYRFGINLFLHVALFLFSYLAAHVMLYGNQLVDVMGTSLLFTVVPFVLIQTLFFYYYDMFQGLWRYVSFVDLLNIIRAALLSCLAFYALGAFWGRVCLPEQMYVADTLMCIITVGGVRLVVRNLREKVMPWQRHLEARLIILIGPVADVQPVVKDFMGKRESRYLPVAIVNPTLVGRAGGVRLNDIPVYPLDRAVDHLRRFNNLHAAVFCWGGATVRQMEGVIKRLQELQLPFMKLPPLEAIVSGDVSVNDIKKVELNDLLERQPVRTDLEAIQTYLGGKSVLVTGGGGSIGSELCRQIAAFSPAKLIVLDRSENSLMDLQIELRRRFEGLNLVTVIASVNDASGLIQWMRQEAVQVVFHAAAYKHVPLMEAAPIESAYNNVVGTFNTARAALEAGVERFVMISTDKAVNPTNVMGVTKRIAEMIVQGFNQINTTKFMTVRFGNVLGSAGSVIPIFMRQIEAGGPVTVTDPEIERFFMTIPEAVQLVLQASLMGNGGEIFVLDMGESVKILRLAEKLITLSGMRPHEDIEIKYTGLRPGEKMYEELFNTAEAHIPTAHDRINAAQCAAVDPEELKAAVQEIKGLIREKDVGKLIELFQTLVPGYQPRIAMDTCETEAPAAAQGEVLRPALAVGRGKLVVEN